jgi:hypothetical protein
LILASAVKDEEGNLAFSLANLGDALRFFDGFVFRVTTTTHRETLDALRGLDAVIEASVPNLMTVGRERRGAVASAVAAGADYVVFSDLDHLLRWFHADEAECARVLDAGRAVDCRVVGRAPTAFDDAPRAVRDTERLVNLAFERLTGRTWDLLSSVRVLSRRGAETICEKSSIDTIATDVDWPLLCMEAGLVVEYQESRSLNYRPGTLLHEPKADPDDRGSAASWLFRLRIAGWMAEAMTQYEGLSPT